MRSIMRFREIVSRSFYYFLLWMLYSIHAARDKTNKAKKKRKLNKR